MVLSSSLVVSIAVGIIIGVVNRFGENRRKHLLDARLYHIFQCDIKVRLDSSARLGLDSYESLQFDNSAGLMLGKVLVLVYSIR
ncbi:30788_t:CDS:2 [Gigaspora margarita]|uniref:30788_t:CDS:1 n=1 Tax=Gigaspora margarita TaxID=4874 RepID=A0ABN7UEE3_GIGMA|nr:30788_t:CDS:2 [Gigaspora margarita]